MSKSRTLNALLILLSVLIFASTVSFLTVYNVRTKRAREERLQVLNETIEPFITEYNELVSARKLKTNEYKRYYGFGKSMTTLLFQECTENLYSDVYLKATKRYNAKGVFTLTDTETVGAEGCITKEEYDVLTKQGWAAAVGFPETIPAGFDPAAYFDRVKKNLSEQGVPLPKILVFARENYTRELYEASLHLMPVETVYFNYQDERCDLEANSLSSPDDVLLIPYLYTSKRTPVRSGFEMSLKQGLCISLSTRGARSGMVGETATHDTTLGSLKDIVETIKINHTYYRSYDDYRQERLLADTEYRNKLDQTQEQLDDLNLQIRILNRRIINVFAEAVED